MSGVLKPDVNERDHVIGGDRALVTLVEFGDYECPYCGRAQPVVERIKQQLGDRLRLVFRHFPLTSAHPHALLAAQAAEAAAAQGAFWKMHALLYANQHALELADLLEYANDLELDVPRVGEELTTRHYLERVRANVRSGAQSGVNGTPTFFIDGHRHDGSWDYDTLIEAMATSTGAELGI
jgi:protein-disulfide isomerase